MNLLCPHCQKMLTVPDENAGQVMKCPSCGAAFTVPALPQGPGAASVPPDLPANVPPEPPPEPEPAAPEPEPDEAIYRVAVEPPRPSPPPPPRREERLTSPPPTLPREERVRAVTPSPRREERAAPPPPEIQPAAKPPPPPPPPPPAGYSNVYTIRFSPQVIPWIPPVALAIALLLFFFTWTGAYPGGYGVYTQSGWWAIWGSVSTDPVGEKALGGNRPFESVGANPLLFLYLVLVLAALAAAVAVLLQPRTSWQLPPALQRIWPWRLALVGGLTLLALLILLLQLSFGFGLERAVTAQADRNLESEQARARTDEDHEIVAIQRGLEVDRYHLRRTIWLRLTVLCLLVALAGGGLEFWLQKRGARPVPRLDLQW